MLFQIWRLFLPRNETPFSIREHAGHTTKISMEHVLSTDSRDRKIMPTTGSLYQLTTELAGPIGDSTFFKYIFDYQVDNLPIFTLIISIINISPFIQTAAQLPFYGLIFGASFRLANVKGIGQRGVHLLDRLYAGGPYDVRGFEQNSIGVRSDNCSLGGGASLTSALHLYAPLIPADMV
jgi:outer membrane protein insertion porin family